MAHGADDGTNCAEKTYATATECLLTAPRVDHRLILSILILGLSVSFVILHLFAGYFGHPEAHFYRTIHLTGILILAYIMYPLGRKSWQSPINIWFAVDVLAIILTLFTTLYYLLDMDGFAYRTVDPANMDIVVGWILYVLVIEAARRVIGLPMVLIALAFTAHTMFADKTFWLLYGPSTSPRALMLDMFMQEGGIFGMPLGTIASFVVLYLIFGSMLTETGTGMTFTDLAFGLVGRSVGGPAKASVVGSGFFGMISGSSVANVMADGPITIPMMQRVGFKAETAAGIEALASTGGMFTPPIMGATAFIVASFLGTSYLHVAASAAIPAFCYYFALFCMVHFMAIKGNMRLPADEQLPNVRKVLREGYHLLLPIAALTGFLMAGFTASTASFWAILALFFTACLKPKSRITSVGWLRICEDAAASCVTVSMACAAAGIIVSATTLSGVGLRLGSAIVQLAQGQLWLALIFAAMLAVLLGMGLTTTAVYIIMMVTVIPVMERMGVVPIAAHFYALFFGVLSNVIPPVAIASFAAAGVAGTDPAKTAWAGFLVGLPGILVMASFVYRPGLLLVGTVPEIVFDAVTTMVAVAAMSASLANHAWARLSILTRLALFALGFACLSPIRGVSAVASVGSLVMLGMNMQAAKRAERTVRAAQAG